MRTRFIMAAMNLFILSSCQDAELSALEIFLEGTYIHRFENEFSKGESTIEILWLPRFGTDLYEIIKRSHYQQTIDGKVLPPKEETKRFTALLDRETGTMTLKRLGVTLSFDPKNNELRYGTTIYKKIK